MAYPQKRRKHTFEAFINPEDFKNYEKSYAKIKFPKKIILVYQKNLIEYFKRKYKGHYKRHRIVCGEIYIMKDIGVVKVSGVGAPVAAMIVDELIPWGIKEVLNVGCAGGLIEKTNFLCNKAVRDEGTSHHYIKNSRYAYPDKELFEKLKKVLDKNKVEYQIAPTWSIDAPYRETKKEVKHYQKKGIGTVEMEASAVFTVAEFRKIKAAALFTVSDLLTKDKWDPHFHTFDYKKNLYKILDIAMECFGYKRNLQ